MTTREYAPGDPLQGDIDVDVAIVGGGFTGLFRQIRHFINVKDLALKMGGRVFGF